MSEGRDLPPPPDPNEPGWDGAELAPEPALGPDVLGGLAVVLGFIGLVTLGIVSAIVTAVVASMAGARARDQRRSFDTAYFALILAALDGVVWIVLHYRFHLPIWAG